MRIAVHEPYTTTGTAALASLWLLAPDFWVWVAAHLRDGGIIVPALSAIWLSVQIVNVVSGWWQKWRDRE